MYWSTKNARSRMCCPCDACSQDRENSHFFRGLSVRSASLKCWMDRRGAALDPRKWHVVYSKHYELKHGEKKKSYVSYIFSSNWNHFKRLYSLCLCNEGCLIKSFYLNVLIKHLSLHKQKLYNLLKWFQFDEKI